MQHTAVNGWQGREVLIQSILFVAILGLYSLNWFDATGTHFGHVFGDVTTIAAERVQAGQIPYRDFWTMYAPGSYYLLALLFTLFGNHVTVGTVAASLLCAAAATVCYRLARELTGRSLPALACAAVFFAATWSTAYYLSLGPYPPTIFFVLLALLYTVRYHGTGRAGRLFTAGLATGAAVVFKHDVGGYTAIAIAAGLLAGHCTGPRPQAAALPGAVGELLVYSAGAALVALPVTAYFAWHAGADMWQDLIVFPATDFRFARVERYPSLIPGDFHGRWWLNSVLRFFDEYLQYALPFLVAVTAAVIILLAARRRRTACLPAGVTFGVAYLLHYLSAHVQINTNIISMPMYAALLGAIAYTLVADTGRFHKSLPFRGGALLLAVVAVVMFAAHPAYSLHGSYSGGVELELPKVSGLRVSPDMRDTLTELVSLVDANVPRGRKMFIGLHRHDTTVIGDGKLYFILDRMNATRHDQLHPGVASTRPRQLEMIRDLQANDVTFILLKHVFPDKALDKLKEMWKKTLPESGSTVLDEYIRSNYRKIRTIDKYEVWLRKDTEPVPGGTL